MSLVEISLGLHKQAQEKKEKNRHVALTAAGSVVASSGAQGRLMGYETVHHGTTKHENVMSIKKHGLKKSHAGTGAGAVDMAVGHVDKDNLKGRVFSTTNKTYASHYTKNGIFDSPDERKVVTAHMPYHAKSRLHTDKIMDEAARGVGVGKNMSKAEQTNAKRLLDQTRVYKHGIKTRFIEGGKDYAGKKQFLNAGHMRRYLSQAGGKARFATGVAQSAASAGLGALALRNAAKSLKEKKDAK